MFFLINHIRFVFYLYRVSQNKKYVKNLIDITKKCGPLAIKLLQYILMRNNIINVEKLHFVF